MSTSARPSVLVLPALALLALATGCQGSSAAAQEPVPSASAAPRTGHEPVNGLAAEQEAEAAARVAAEAEAARIAAEAEAARIAAEAEAARIAEEQTARDAEPRTAVAGGPAKTQAAPRPSTGQAPPPAPAPAGPVDFWVDLTDKSCSFDGVDTYRMQFTVVYSDGHRQRINNYTGSGGPYIANMYTSYGGQDFFTVRPADQSFEGFGC
ncbi:hypothetical protein [Candidatus Blastococcus massiliensis]|uniref:hypothetical protein n=1 Tax=Candidatus Blastococcus massiliensis TaxID=1470358 RepID=UPI0004B3A1D4|nr:hypothetical protein [Candidatus Blastococcus massiliensis]